MGVLPFLGFAEWNRTTLYECVRGYGEIGEDFLMSTRSS